VPDQDPPRTGFRQGLKLLLIAGCLTPLIFLFEGLLPSRENTRIDELPQIVLTVGLLGLALAGVARMAYALLVERRNAALPAPDGQVIADPRLSAHSIMNAPKQEQLPVTTPRPK